jgi:hypothetical protein
MLYGRCTHISAIGQLAILHSALVYEGVEGTNEILARVHRSEIYFFHIHPHLESIDEPRGMLSCRRATFLRSILSTP